MTVKEYIDSAIECISIISIIVFVTTYAVFWTFIPKFSNPVLFLSLIVGFYLIRPWFYERFVPYDDE